MIIYVTNKWAHYQGSVCRELAKLLGSENFKMLLLDPLETNIGGNENEIHKKMNWSHHPPREDWIVQPPETVKELLAGDWISMLRNADIAVVGAMYGCKETFSALNGRIADGKLTFIVNERYFKTKLRLRDFVNLHLWRLLQVLHWRFSKKNVHYMPTAYNGPKDLRFMKACKGKMWRWAYFPEVSDAPTEKPIYEKMRVCWCGRMIRCKHVEYIIEALALLKNETLEKIDVTIVGEGETRTEMEQLAKKRGVDGVVSFKPFLSPMGVLDFLTGQDVYVFGSDRGEGWGCALQESMDKCCVPIANEEAGVTLCVVKDGENGFTFKDGDVGRVADRLEWLLEHPKERKAMGIRAWETMQQWSPKVGAERLVMLIDAIKAGDYSKLPQDGLCSNVG